MRINVTRAILGIVSLMLLASVEVGAQTFAPQPRLPPLGGAQLTVGQLDQMLAPVALYPDPLLAQILMSATYPLGVVQADRWLQNPDNAALTGDQLNAALALQTWDPSVKSLVPFPQILRMLDSNLTWTEQLGDTFLANQPAVMESVQRLRQNAQNAGQLQSTPEEVVTSEGPAISIEPANQEIVYVPVYNPNEAYGIWPYPDYPPFYFTGFFGGLDFGWFQAGINMPLWGWGRPDWGRHRIDIDGNRFNAINAHRPPITSGAWQHDPSRRSGVPYHDSRLRTQFQREDANPDRRRIYRGYPATAAAPPNGEFRAPPQAFRPTRAYRPPSPPPALESFGHGNVRAQSERGFASRQSMSAWRGGEGRQQFRQPSAPTSGGREHR